jgi:hypothetical protein
MGSARQHGGHFMEGRGDLDYAALGDVLRPISCWNSISLNEKQLTSDKNRNALPQTRLVFLKSNSESLLLEHPLSLLIDHKYLLLPGT